MLTRWDETPFVLAQAFGPPAATVAGVYGVLMLLVGAAAAQLLPKLKSLRLRTT